VCETGVLGYAPGVRTGQPSGWFRSVELSGIHLALPPPSQERQQAIFVPPAETTASGGSKHIDWTRPEKTGHGRMQEARVHAG